MRNYHPGMSVAESLLPPSSTKCSGFDKEAKWTCPVREKCVRFFYYQADVIMRRWTVADQHFERCHRDPCPYYSIVRDMTYREFKQELFRIKYEEK